MQSHLRVHAGLWAAAALFMYSQTAPQGFAFLN
jgi:hypothetical protein